MRIQHNITALNSYNKLSTNNSAVAKNLEKLSSGYKINRAGDDAAGLAISEKMRAQITGLETASKNAEDAVSLVQTAEGALTEVHSMLNRMVALATQSANGTYNSTNRNSMNEEVDQLKSEIDRILSTTNFNGLEIFTGTNTKITFQVSETGIANAQIGIDLTTMNTETLKIDKVKIGGTDATTNKVDQKGAREQISVITAAIDKVSKLRGSFGAMQNRLEHTINNLAVSTENITASESRIRDVDMAKEMMAYTKNNILVQSAQAMLAQANQVPQSVLQLLQ
ncbi:MAG: flagellin [Oscillospiraceae bacterium]|jgi:flagellin|nr:flagellin [Oscillospiraceae bacterium]MCI9390272.1 flagellin [Lachnospiraceae bacterium]